MKDGKTYILGINSAYHESAACLLEDGTIVAAAEEERFNRVKHGKRSLPYNPDELPVKAMAFCFARAGITWEHIDHIAYSLDPEVRREKNLAYTHAYTIPYGDFGHPEGEELFYRCCLRIPEKLSLLAGRDIKSIFTFIPHHTCHAASSFYVSPFQEAAVIAIDGIGEFASTWIGEGKGNSLRLLKEIDYPASLGFLWEKFSKFFGFSEYDACKVMGLATSAEVYIPGYMRQIFSDIVTLLPGGEFAIDDSIMKFRVEDYSMLSKLFYKEKRDRAKDPTATIQEMIIASALQLRTEEAIFHMVDYALEKTKKKNLCLSGGVALNSVVNAKLEKRYPEVQIFIQPAAHDAGTAIGAAYYIWHDMLKNSRPAGLSYFSPYLGPDYSDLEVEEALKARSLPYRKFPTLEELVDHVAARLHLGKIIGWYQGRLEIGPRALGNRSLLASPVDGRIKEIINAMGIKNREEFRPFAPSMREEQAQEWVDVKGTSPYMLNVYNVRKEKLGLIDAVTHSDRTARIQTVNKEQNPRYHALLSRFHEISGLPLFLNTSFNSQEPIVTTPGDAIQTYLNTKFDMLVMSTFVVER